MNNLSSEISKVLVDSYSTESLYMVVINPSLLWWRERWIL